MLLRIFIHLISSRKKKNDYALAELKMQLIENMD